MKILAFGEILFDVIEGKHFLGGAPLNFAAHIARFGAESYIFSRVGEDELGQYAQDKIEKLGVKADFIQKDADKETGIVKVVLENGQPDYTICENVAYDFIEKGNPDALKKIHFEVLYFGTLAQRNEKSRDTLARLVAEVNFKHIFYDVNLRKGFFSEEILTNSLRNCTILKLNDEEVNVLGEMIFQQSLNQEAFAHLVSERFSIEVVVITAGEKGCLVYKSGKMNFVKGYPAQVVDTVGAGDSFSAAFLYHFASGKNPLVAADMANKLGAFVASSRGPIPEYSLEIMEALNLKRKIKGVFDDNV